MSFSGEALEKSNPTLPIANPRQGHEKDQVEIQAWTLGCKSPYDVVSAAPAGKRRGHHAVTIRRALDKATPLFFSALAAGEPLACKIELFKADTGGLRPRPSYIAELSGGRILSIKLVPAGTKGSTGSGGRSRIDQAELQFVFQMIDVTWNDGGITMHDDWFQPV